MSKVSTYMRMFLVRWRYVGVVIGVALGMLTAGFLIFPERNSQLAIGPMNTGHEALSCQECHTPVRGTAAQQISANVHYWFGLRNSTIGFGSSDVESESCLDCHERPDDRHPISRFLEPRFADARKHIKAHMCVTCHTEHRGVRITEPTIGYCTHCHQDMAVEEDPISPTHEQLVSDNAWNTCLRCHDFHGNHVWNTPTKLIDGVTEEAIRRYFAGGSSPYGDEKIAESSTTKRDRNP